MNKSLLILVILVFGISASNEINTRPIIGIFTEPSDTAIYPATNYSFIAASYVKYLETGGAQVVPIFYDATREYLDDIFLKINGVLFPGGAVEFTYNDTVDSIFLRNAAYLIEKAKNATDHGDYFPIWGTCLGFELVSYIESGFNKSIIKTGLNDTGSHTIYDVNLGSKLFNTMPEYFLDYIESYPAVYYHHTKGVQKESFDQNKPLGQSLRVTSQSLTSQNISYVATFESRQYPIFGSQFHPEKNMFEWKENIPHDYKSIQAVQYFADFFVNQTRQNFHSFNGTADENKYLIYQYPVYALNSSSYTQIYILPNFGNPEVNYTEAYVPKPKNNTIQPTFVEQLLSNYRIN